MWRYDPIFLTETYSLNYHIETFKKMAETLKGFTDCCVISFIDLHEKAKRNFPQAKEVEKEESLELGREFVRIGKPHGMQTGTCCGGMELAGIGADCSGCMTKDMFERAIGEAIWWMTWKSTGPYCRISLKMILSSKRRQALDILNL